MDEILPASWPTRLHLGERTCCSKTWPSPQTAPLIRSKIFQAVHDSRYVYVEYQNGEREFYDLQLDPLQLTNVVNDPAYSSTVSALQAQLTVLRNQ